MTDQWLTIKVRKAILLLREQELLAALPPELLVKALRRGKRLLRRRRMEAAFQYTEACPRCGRRPIRPYSLRRAPEGGLVGRYRCPGCAHRWWTGWAVDRPEYSE